MPLGRFHGVNGMLEEPQRHLSAASHALIATFEGARNVKLPAVGRNLDTAGEESIKEFSTERSLCTLNTDRTVCPTARDAKSNKQNDSNSFISTMI